jgi:UDP-glucose/iron transport system ATP-binding protein
MTGAAAGTDSIFQLEQVSLTYPATHGQPRIDVLHDVSVALPRGGALALVGPSGSGKSTLLRCLNRLVEPTVGVVRFEGRDVRSLDPRDLRRRAALVMQTAVLFEGTVRDNLRMHPADVPFRFDDERLARVVEEVGLDRGFLERDAGTLSGGERQRVSLARALLRDPQALLLDEPTSALDPPNAALVVEAVLRLRESRRLSIVAVTHQPDLVRRLGGALLYLVRGRVEAYEALDGAPHAASDARLQAFLSGEHAAVREARP